jgi:hypothetical protein
LVNGYGSKAAAGWTKDYSGTNKAAYRMGAGGTADRMFLRVWDDNSGTGQIAKIQGFRTMSGVDVGVRPFAPFNYNPDANGLSAWKTYANGDAARAWAIVASPTALWVFNELNVAAASLGSVVIGSNPYASNWFFGEYKKRFVGHTMNVAIVGSHHYGTATGVGYSGQCGGKRMNGTTSYSNSISTSNSHWLARPYAGIDGPTTFAKTALFYCNIGTGAGANDDWTFGSGGPGPNPSMVDAKLRLSKIELVGTSPALDIIGEMPGAFSSIGGFWLPPNQIIEGVGTLAGNSYFVGMAPNANGAGAVSAPGQILINLTDW